MFSELIRIHRWRGALTLGSGLTLGSLLLWAASPAGAQVRPELAQNPLAGSQVFGSKGCVKCHSVNGLGGTLAPDLGASSRRHSFYELAAAMWNHMPEMGKQMEELGIARPAMDAEEAGDLIAFLFTLDYFDPPGDVEVGKKLFTEKKCVACHQIGLFGGVSGPSLDHLSQYGSPILVAASMWNHGPAMAEEMEARGLTRPTFSGSELSDLIAYLESVGPRPLQGPLYVLPGRAAEGRVVFVERQCIECHSVGGVGGRVGPDLAEREMQVGLTEFAAAMWNKEPAMIAAMEARDITVPQLGAGEMADLVAYLYSIQYFAVAGDPYEGRTHLTTKRCLECHSFSGVGGNGGSDLSQVSELDSPAAVMSQMWNHSALMEAGTATREREWPSLTSEEMADIIALFQSMQLNF